MIGCADLNPQRAQAEAKQHNTTSYTVTELLSSNAEIIVNLTPHTAPASVTLQALEAKKHVYTEKPIGLTMNDAQQILVSSTQKNLRVGCAPDTFLGATWQSIQHALRAELIGQVMNIQISMLSRGPEFVLEKPDSFMDSYSMPYLTQSLKWFPCLVQ